MQKLFPSTYPDFELKNQHRYLLTEARKILKASDQVYLCRAIQQACDRSFEVLHGNSRTKFKMERACRELKRYIMRALEGYTTLNAWYSVKNEHSTLCAPTKARRKWAKVLLNRA